jgi:hypothetical protein
MSNVTALPVIRVERFDGPLPKLSAGAKRMLGGIAEFEISDRPLPFDAVDFRVFPRLMRLGLVASNIYQPHGGVSFTPLGRRIWNTLKTSNRT